MGHFEGKLTLQLINAKTGKLEQEVHSHNFAANQVNEYGRWLQKSVIKAGLSSLGVTDTVYAPHLPTNTIVLTDSTEPEDPVNEWFMSGATLGWASKATYAGTDIWRGTVSTSALEASPTSVKWVFDWPTQAGNGVIGSVGWVDSTFQVLSPTNPEFKTSMTLQSSHVSAGGWTRFTQASSILAFGNTGNTIIYVLDGSDYTQTTTFNINAQFASVRGIAWDSVNSFLWVIGDDIGANRIIAAYDESGILQTGPFTLTNRAYSLLAFDGTQLWSLTASGTTITAWGINTTDGNDTTNFNFTINNSNGICGFTYDSTRNLFWTRQLTTSGSVYPGIQAWDNTGKKASTEFDTSRVFQPASGAYNLNLSTTNGATHRDFDLKNSNEFLVQSTSTIYVCRADGMATRSLLPVPVSKNNTQTLKVIYQINYV